MKKFFVLDTTVLLHSPMAVSSFADNIVVLPMTVIEELDHFKTKSDELGRNARAVIRHIDHVREEEEAYAASVGQPAEQLTTGITHNDAGGKIMVIDDEHLEFVPGLIRSIPDNRILRAAVQLQLDHKEQEVILVSKDLNLRIKAAVWGVEPQDFTLDKVADDERNGASSAAHAGASIVNVRERSPEQQTRYQVFLSSTFNDLFEVRKRIIDYLWKMGFIVAGMERFAASNQPVFDRIKRDIDYSDYYVLIIGGRYGSTDADGVSFTELEFDYAVEKRSI